jgi:hypothetical protein
MSNGAWMDPLSLNIAGSTQPQLSASTIAAMAQELHDPKRAVAFWQNSLTNDGPIEIWEISGQRFLMEITDGMPPLRQACGFRL